MTAPARPQRRGSGIGIRTHEDCHPPYRGVWDTVQERWDRGRAAWHATTLSLRYDESGERPDTAAGWIDPPRPVILNFTVSRTERALHHMWVREPDGWHGWVSYLERCQRADRGLQPSSTQSEVVDGSPSWSAPSVPEAG
jgi:hypothetical protein